MKHLKKLGALILSMLLLCQAVCFAEATPAELAEKPPQHLAAEELNKLAVMVGNETGDLMLEKTVTRAEMAAIICRISGLEQAAKDVKAGSSVFSDVTEGHWAAGYIQLAQQNGIINGYPDGTFLPEKEVSYAETIKMLIAVMGYLPKAEAMGAYPHGVFMVANELGMTTDLVILSEKPAIRSDIALLVYRSMDIPLMVQITFGPDAQFEVMPDLTLRNQHFEMIK